MIVLLCLNRFVGIFIEGLKQEGASWLAGRLAGSTYMRCRVNLSESCCRLGLGFVSRTLHLSDTYGWKVGDTEGEKVFGR